MFFISEIFKLIIRVVEISLFLFLLTLNVWNILLLSLSLRYINFKTK